MKRIGALTVLLALAGCGDDRPAMIDGVQSSISIKGATYRYVGQTADDVVKNAKHDGTAHMLVGRGDAIYESDAPGPPLQPPELVTNPVLHNSPGFDHSGVIGNDERFVVPDGLSTNLPWAANFTMAWQNVAHSDGVLCSATCVGPHTAVSAAHCIFKAGGGYFRTFEFAAMGSNTTQHYPTQACLGNWAIPTGYVTTNNISDYSDDMAMLDFTGCSQSLCQLSGYIGWSVNANIGTTGVNTDGYPGFCGCSGALNLTGQCAENSTQAPGTPAMNKFSLPGSPPRLWYTANLDMTDGASGSGVFWYSGGWKLLGTAIGTVVGTFGAPTYNYYRNFDSDYLGLVQVSTDY